MVGKRKLTSLRRFLGLILVFIIISSLSGCASTKSNKDSKEMVTIGISQIVENPVLDLAQGGFVEALKDKGYEEGKNIEIDIQFAQGDIALTTTIAENFVSQKKDLILAISTASAQSTFQSTKEIPILFTAVTDPVKAGLVQNLDSPEENITGTHDLVPMDNQFELGKSIFPDAKKVGVPYNTSEVNSQVQIELIKEAAKVQGLEVVEIPVTNSSELELALTGKINEVDFLFLPSDTLIASSMPIISKVALDNKIGSIGVDEPMVRNGALACKGLNYHKLGYQTGLMAVEILEGKDIRDIPVVGAEEIELTINKSVADKLGLTLPDSIMESAVIIEEED